MANVQSDLDAGDEGRHTGDRLGFPHPVPDGTAEDDVAANGPDEGIPVAFDGTDIATVTGDNSDDVAGIVFTYQYYGDSTNGPYVRGDRDATVAVRGSYVADLTPYVDGTATVAEGGSLGANGEIYVKNTIDAGNNLYEVVLR